MVRRNNTNPVETTKVTTTGEKRMRKRGAGATTMTLSISAEDKMRVKAYAASQATTVSDLLHQWIAEKCGE